MVSAPSVNWANASATPMSAGDPALDSLVFAPSARRTVNLDVFARETGAGLRQVYELARRDALPIPVIRIGRRMVVSREALDVLLAPAPRSTDAA